MIKTLPTQNEWLAFVAVLPKKSRLGDAALPENLAYRGSTWVGAWVPPDAFWEIIRAWMQSREEESVFYFLLEGIADEDCFFESEIADLTDDTLSDINPGYRCAVVAKDFSWVVSSDDSKNFHVAGPEELYRQLIEWGKADRAGLDSPKLLKVRRNEN